MWPRNSWARVRYSFDKKAVDYLLKPVEKERLQEAVAKCLENKAVRVANEEKQRLLEMVVSLSGKSETAINSILESGEELLEQVDRLAIKDGSSITFVPT